MIKRNNTAFGLFGYDRALCFTKGHLDYEKQPRSVQTGAKTLSGRRQ